MKIFRYTALSLIVLIFAGILTLQMPAVQTYLAGKIAKSATERFTDAIITFDRIQFKPFNTLILNNVVIIDKMPCSITAEDVTNSEAREKFDRIGTERIDTFFTASRILAHFSLKGLLGRSVNISEVYLSDAVMNLVIEDGESSTNLTRIFRIPKTKKKDVIPKEVFHIKELDLDNVHFRMKDYTTDRGTRYLGGIDWNDLDVSAIMAHGRHLRLTGKIMTGELDHLSFREKSGYSVTSISGRTRVGEGMAEILDINLRDLWSRVHLERYAMLYEDEEDFKEYIDKVVMEIELGTSDLAFKSLSYFVPQLEGNPLTFSVKGRGMGTVRHLSIAGLEFSAKNGSLSGRISGSIDGLPEIEELSTDLRLEKTRFSSFGIDRFINSWTSDNDLKIRQFGKGLDFRMNASAKGPLNRLRVKARVLSSAGEADAAITITGLLGKGKALGMNGTLETKNLTVSKIYSKVPIHECTLDAGITAEFGGKPSGNRISIDSLKVSRLNFNGYDYSKIQAKGLLEGGRFDGKLICSDPNLNFLFQGVVTTSKKTDEALYRFYANLGYADLYALNIDRRGRSEIQFRTKADFISRKDGVMAGDIEIAGMVLENSLGKHDIGNITVSSQTGSGRDRITLDSKFLQGEYSGSSSVGTFIKDLKAVTLNREIPALEDSRAETFSGNDYNLSLKTLRTIGLLSFIAPGTYIAENSSLGLTLDSDGKLNVGMDSRRLAFKDQYIKDISLQINNLDSTLTGKISSSEISAASFQLKDGNIEMFADNNHLGVAFRYDNRGDLDNRGELVMICNVSRNEGETQYDLELLPSTVYLNSRQWNIFRSNARIHGRDIYIGNMELRSEEQAVTASGGFSNSDTDTLNINLENFDLSIVNHLMKKKSSIKGRVTGMAQVTSPLETRALLADFVCDSAGVAGRNLGRLDVSSKWNPDYRRFDISLANDINGKSTVDVDGNYSPALKRLEMQAVLDSMEIGYFHPFLEEIFSDFDGRISGLAAVEGPLDNLEIRTDGMRIDESLLTIAYTNVPYNASGAFHADGDGVYFDEITIKDRFGNTGSVTGGIAYNHFKDLEFDTHIRVSRMEAVNLTQKQSEYFYGNLFASGDVSVTGPLKSILLSADAVTSKEGNIHIPINSTVNAGTTDLLKFKEADIEYEIDPYEEMMQNLRKRKTSESDFSLRLKVEPTQEVEAFIEIDKESGNILSGKGTGNIEIDMGSGGDDFQLKGDYTISSGNFHFVALGIAARDFTLNEGSTIRFNGDIMETNLNIGATYKTKASLSTLIADTSSVNNRRPVECGLAVSGQLKNPRLNFSINIPDLDPVVKSRVESALSTEDKVQKQFLSLLISNGFLPDEQSGIVNNSSVLMSNVTEIMANQVNNIFQKLNIPLDLGLSYQQNSRGRSIFDVAVSTQLFNNRVVVNGNIGNRQYQTSNSKSDVVGDLDIEIKLDRQGVFRLNLFSHSADQYSNYLDNSQRNGVGLTFQQEFNRLGQLVRRTFAGRKKREKMEMEAIEAARNEEKVRLKIAPEAEKEKRK